MRLPPDELDPGLGREAQVSWLCCQVMPDTVSPSDFHNFR